MDGLVFQNKDEVKIPLILTTIPTPKQFRKKVSSLSPEQQAFAKAYVVNKAGGGRGEGRAAVRGPQSLQMRCAARK